jgi:hypothetical protein
MERVAFDTKRNGHRLEAIRYPETKAQQCRTKLLQLSAKTAEIEYELDLRKQLEVESKRHAVATMKLKAANRTLSEQKTHDEETRRFQIALSRVTSPEQHPDWRLQQNANLAFYRQQIPPGSKRRF